MSLDTVRLSVVIPLYNKADTIGRSLSSVLSQSLKDFEAIVVDDGSTDAGGEIVAATADRRVRLMRQQNAGAAAARNTGISAARGSWIALIDADDFWSPDHLETLLAAASDTDVVLAFSNVRLQSRAGRPLIDPAVKPQRIEDYFRFALAHGGYPASASSVLIRRDQLVASGLFPQGIPSGEDVDTWCRLACRGTFLYTARPTAMYFDRPQRGAGESNRPKPIFPFFVERLPEMIHTGSVPPRLVGSAERYANFLLLEYARQLLDCDESRAARAILLGRCRLVFDPKRYVRRLARTWPVGRMLFRLAGGVVGG